MSKENQNNSTQIVIAVIGLVGVLGGALIASWDKIFSPSQPPGDGKFISTPSPLPSSSLVQPPLDQRVRVREKSREFFEALEKHDGETLNRILAEEFKDTSSASSSGMASTANKSSFINQVMSYYEIPVRFEDHTIADIYVDENSARVTGYVRVTITKGGQTATGRAQFTQHFVYRVGDWQLTSHNDRRG